MLISSRNDVRNRTHKSLIIAKICAISLRDRPRIRKIEPIRVGHNPQSRKPQPIPNSTPQSLGPSEG